MEKGIRGALLVLSGYLIYVLVQVIGSLSNISHNITNVILYLVLFLVYTIGLSVFIKYFSKHQLERIVVTVIIFFMLISFVTGIVMPTWFEMSLAIFDPYTEYYIDLLFFRSNISYLGGVINMNLQAPVIISAIGLVVLGGLVVRRHKDA